MANGQVRVLFLRTGNSARSQMAESMLRHLSHGPVDVASAGTEPKPEIHPMARKAVQTQFGLNMAGRRPKSVDQFLNEHFDCVVTVCDNAAETCPVFPGAAERIQEPARSSSGDRN